MPRNTHALTFYQLISILGWSSCVIDKMVWSRGGRGSSAYRIRMSMGGKNVNPALIILGLTFSIYEEIQLYNSFK